MQPFVIDGLTLSPCYDDRIDEYVGCLDEDGEYEACENCIYYNTKCPINGEEEG